MKAFLDTNVYIAFYRSGSHLEFLHRLNGEHTLFLHAVVLAELLAGAKTPAFLKELARLEKIFSSAKRIIVPQKRDYLAAGKLLRKLQGTTSLLADSLLAASARHEGMLFVTEDKDFERIKRLIPFQLTLLPSSVH